VAEIRLTRGSLVESRHQVSFCVWRNGEVVRSSGDVTAPVFYRSAAKPLQAIAVVESGAPDRFGFTDEELAMVVGSHDGAPANAAAARSMLGKRTAMSTRPTFAKATHGGASRTTAPASTAA
jgi:L-asparaginase II